MTPPVTSPLPPPPEPFAETFPYGWRYVNRPGANGEVECDQVPLTLEDVLHPQEGDVIPENTVHHEECGYIFDVFKTRLSETPGALVLCDCLINWGNDGVRAMSPDIAVIFQVADPTLRRGTFYTAEEGTRPRLVIENVSPDTRTNDVRKIDLYHQVRIPDYVMIDQRREEGPRSLVHYTWAPAGYIPVASDDDCVLLQVVGLRLCLHNNRVVLFDAHTGEEIRDYTQLDWAHKASERARADAEREAREQTRARADAEREAQEQTRARRDAEREAQDQARARETAEHGREDAERRLRDLEAEMRRLRGEPPPGPPAR